MRHVGRDGMGISRRPRSVNLSFIYLDHKSRRDSQERPYRAAGSQGWVVVPLKTIDLVECIALKRRIAANPVIFAVVPEEDNTYDVEAPDGGAPSFGWPARYGRGS